MPLPSCTVQIYGKLLSASFITCSGFHSIVFFFSGSDEDNAQGLCEEYSNRAVSTCQTNAEAHLMLASLRCIESCTEGAQHSLNAALELLKHRDAESGASSYSFETRTKCVRLCMELARYTEALELLEELLLEDDRYVELWYMTGACYVEEGDGIVGAEYLQRALAMLEKVPNQDLSEVINETLQKAHELTPPNSISDAA